MSDLDGIFTQSASTKRNPAAVGGVVGAPAAKLTSVSIMPLVPADPEVTEKYKIQSPRKAFMTAIEGNPDILEGDILTVGTMDYAVRVVEPITAPIQYTGLIIEQVK